jgi:molecular chaperone GrpE
VSDQNPNYILSQQMRDLLMQQIGEIKKENVLLQQSLREQQTQNTAQNEDLFLELLEVVDAIEALQKYLENNPQPSVGFIERLPRSVSAVHRKFLSVLGKRQVLPIELVDKEPDFNLCRVVDREERTDVPDQTITKIVRRGFRWGEKILRPTEVITAQVKSSLKSNLNYEDNNSHEIVNQNSE